MTSKKGKKPRGEVMKDEEPREKLHWIGKTVPGREKNSQRMGMGRGAKDHSNPRKTKKVFQGRAGGGVGLKPAFAEPRG